MKYKLSIISVALMIMLASCGNTEESSFIGESVMTTEQPASTTIDAYSLSDEEASSMLEQMHKDYISTSTASTTTAKADTTHYPSYVMFNGNKLSLEGYSASEKKYVFDNYAEFIEKAIAQYPSLAEPYRPDMKFYSVDGYNSSLVYYDNGIYISVDDVDMKFRDDDTYIYIFNLTIENKTDSNLNISSNSLSANDYMFDCSISESIPAGKKTTTSFKLDEKDYAGKIDKSESFNIELYFDATDLSTYQKVLSFEPVQFSFWG